MLHTYCRQCKLQGRGVKQVPQLDVASQPFALQTMPFALRDWSNGSLSQRIPYMLQHDSANPDPSAVLGRESESGKIQSSMECEAGGT